MSQNAESKFVNTKNKKFDFFKSCIKKKYGNYFARNLKVMLQQHHINPICQNFVALRKVFSGNRFFGCTEILYLYAKKDKKWTDRSIDSDKKIQGTSFFFKIFVRRVERQIRR